MPARVRPQKELALPGAEALLSRLVGEHAAFRKDQRAAIEELVINRRRVLCVQRTGWGKSAVYFIATSLLRRAGEGPTVLISPLLALMRNQIEAATRLGIRARTVNSTNRGDWELVRRELEADCVDLLLISPERLNNPAFGEMLGLFAERVGLLVVDEAHCVSDWGHDFRPDYRRIGDVLARLRPGAGVLCTTATANDRVIHDVRAQLAVGGAPEELVVFRGPLSRPSLRLEVVDLARRADRLAWLAQWLPQMPGAGIVYALTKHDTEVVADWLQAQGIAALAYSGDTADSDRLEVEHKLHSNEVKAVVATQALGMGYDKPDLGFVVHYQAPGSVIAFYQQVGRAGRSLDDAEAVLLRGAEDRDIQDYFIESAFPSREHAQTIVDHIARAKHPVRVAELLGTVNVERGRLESLLKILNVEGALERTAAGFTLSGGPWVYDHARYQRVTARRREEQAQMERFGRDGRCLMRTLQEELDDPTAGDCGRCAVCASSRYASRLDRQLVLLAQDHLRRRPLELAPRKQWPASPGTGARKITELLRLASARALARAGDGGWDPLIRAGRLQHDHFSDELVEACVALLAAWRPAPVPEWVAAVPSRRRPTLVPDFASRLANALKLPLYEPIERTGDGPAQREMRNSAQQASNVAGQFAVRMRPSPAPGLIIDDLWYSGWTLTTVAALLRDAGSGPLHGLVLATGGG